MISHKHKAIFIHIPRTGGTSIETMLVGDDLWWHNREQKHIAASKAKEIYAEWWDEYFKFSIVRNPWSRIVSMYRNPNYGTKCNAVEGHKMSYFLKHFQVPKWELNPGTQCQYLDETIDWIGRFENFPNDLLYLGHKLGLDYVGLSSDGEVSCNYCSRPFHHNKTHQGNRKYKDDFQEGFTIDIVAELYKDDIEKFGYSYE